MKATEKKSKNQKSDFQGPVVQVRGWLVTCHIGSLRVARKKHTHQKRPDKTVTRLRKRRARREEDI